MRYVLVPHNPPRDFKFTFLLLFDLCYDYSTTLGSINFDKIIITYNVQIPGPFMTL